MKIKFIQISNINLKIKNLNKQVTDCLFSCPAALKSTYACFACGIKKN